jgi:hypothetical protein
MGFTNFPNGVTSMGAPVPGSHYAGWWGKNVWFVDDDGGGDEQSGKTPTKALKTIQSAITRASYHDTIFLKPREIDQDTHSSHGYYTGTNIIPANKTGLAIIGTGRGAGIGSGVQCMVEPDAASTDETFTVQSPAVTFENLGVKAVTSSKGAIYADVQVAHAYGLTVSNCFFKDFKAVNGGYGTIHTITTHWTTIQHCYFKESGCAISHTALIADARNPTIRDCDFVGSAAQWDADINIGGATGLIIDNCRFHHPVGTGGSLNIYIHCGGTTGANTGMISNCNFSKSTVTVAHCITLVTGILNSHCYGSDAILDT